MKGGSTKSSTIQTWHFSVSEQTEGTLQSLRSLSVFPGRVSFFSSGSENLHRVEKVTWGTRYAITVSFTCDPEHAISDPALPWRRTGRSVCWDDSYERRNGLYTKLLQTFKRFHPFWVFFSSEELWFLLRSERLPSLWGRFCRLPSAKQLQRRNKRTLRRVWLDLRENTSLNEEVKVQQILVLEPQTVRP